MGREMCAVQQPEDQCRHANSFQESQDFPFEVCVCVCAAPQRTAHIRPSDCKSSMVFSLETLAVGKMQVGYDVGLKR